MANKVNNKISKKGTFGTTMGVASVIAILVVLVLVVFAALSIMTAKADLKLSQKTADATTAFYKADSAAEEKLADVAEAAKSGAGWESKLGAGYDTAVSGGAVTVSYEVPIDGNRTLCVRLQAKPGGAVTRELWQVQNKSEWKSDKSLRLIIE
ncbi:MAG: hypothetical protein LBG50_02395 [Clostridiales Family XIII bacterium]|jgi:Tfp pilus assembly protein PilX|nr:hypothetical protein [Clostridiales Family XIII bacterium]